MFELGRQARLAGRVRNRMAVPMIFVSLFTFSAPAAGIPITGLTDEAVTEVRNTGTADSPTLTLHQFRAQVANGADSVVGVFVPGVLAMDVVQQPYNNPGFVSYKAGAATQFRMASQYGSLGLLAHNTVSGAEFYDLAVNQRVYIVYGDGSFDVYIVQQVRNFQALQPYSPYSNFKDLDNGGALLTSTDLFYQTYGVSDQVVFQTCTARDGLSTWGRIFIIATPLADAMPAIWLAPPGGMKAGMFALS